SQCGFCTPGFVMSLFAMRQEARPAERAAINDGLAGNLCRCTGYRPIVDAAMQVLEEQAPDPVKEQRGATEAALRGCDTGGTLALEAAGTRFFAPRDLDTFARLFAANPEATLLAGGTDVGLWVTKQHRRIPLLISTESVAGLRAVETGAGQISIGAAVRYEDALGVLAAHWPSFGALLRRLGSRQIRNRGTIGGNLGNASPIGDSAPALLALDARLVLRRDVERREVPLDDFFTGYRTTILQPGEFIERILVPLPAGEQHFRAYKVAKRFDQDISAVCGAFRVDRAGGTVRDIRIAFGGMAATPARARRTEALLRGGDWSEASVTAAMEMLADEFTPLSDWRASADYRRRVARNLLFKFWLETTGETARTHVLQAEDVA
ncbi:MAG TPA: xanthine dehydrogenase small subunit, partial [Acetobacteraceae bacterium]|nr:xanthine dehydrogenase small subunit [Acetobacteraceae bacterium]